jgi:hypothetical protein
MDNNALIVLIIVLGIIIIVYLLRDRITGLRTRASLEKREGEFELKAAKPQPPSTASQPEAKYSVDISGNKTVGQSKMKVQHDDVRIVDNTLFGKSDIEITDSNSKKSHK